MNEEFFDTEFDSAIPNREDETIHYEEAEPVYSRHYITTRPDRAIIDAWSDGPHPEKDTTNAICINEQGGYQLQLMVTFAEFKGEPYHMRTEENPPIYTDDGIPLYKYVDGEVFARTEDEIEDERSEIPPPPPSAMEQLRADVDFIALINDINL